MNSLRGLTRQEPGAETGVALTRKDRFRMTLDRNRLALQNALPRGVTPERMYQLAQTAVLSSPDLLRCTDTSLLLGLIRCAQLGLEPQSPLGHAYLVPFGNRQKGITEATLIVGYKGYIDLVWRADKILLGARLVREADEFDYQLGFDEALVHRPLRGPVAERGDVIAAYAVARFPDGRRTFDVMWLDEINAIMRTTQFKGDKGPWKDHRGEMQKKTVIRRVAKTLPLSPDSARAWGYDGVAPDEQPEPVELVAAGPEEAVIDLEAAPDDAEAPQDDPPAEDMAPEPPDMPEPPPEAFDDYAEPDRPVSSMKAAASESAKAARTHNLFGR